MLSHLKCSIHTTAGLRAATSAANNIISQANLQSDISKVLFLDEGRKITYGDFVQRAGQYATALTEKYKIKKGDRVMARVSKTTDTAALYAACLQIGALYVPVNPALTQSEAAHYVKDATPSLWITCKDDADQIAMFQKVLKTVCIDNPVEVINEKVLADEAGKRKACTMIEHVEKTDAATICFTSGTTGAPKGAVLSHGALTNNTNALVQEWGFTENDVNLHCLPIFHAHGLYFSLHCSLFSHSTVIWRPNFDAEDCIKHMKNATVFMGVPTFYSRLLATNNFNKEAFEKIRLFLSGSAPLSVPTLEEFEKRTGQVILERYGMTEAGVIASNPLKRTRKAGTVGPAFKGVQCRVSENGEIEIKSDALFSEYWRNPEKTKEEFTEDGWFKTGDVGSLDKDGYLTIGGRSKDMIICGGENIYPKEIEDVIDSIEFVKESAVIASPHPDFGEAVVAVVVPKNEVEDEQKFEEDLIEMLKKKLAKYKVPKKVILVEELPRNHITKVRKDILRASYNKLFS